MSVRTLPAEITPQGTPESPRETPAPQATAPASATPVATAAPAATATPDTGGAVAGELDGEAPGAPLDLVVDAGGIRAASPKVQAFFQVRVKVTNTLDREVNVVIMQGEAGAAARILAAAQTTTTATAKPLQPGSAEVLSPDLDPSATLTLEVERAH